MEYRDFVEQVKEQIQDFLPEKFADAAVEVKIGRASCRERV